MFNFRGELVTSFDDHVLWHPDCSTNNIFVTSGQDLIFSFCKNDVDDIWIEKIGTTFVLLTMWTS